MNTGIIQLDPVGCACTECLVGLYKPLDQASWRDVMLMVAHEVGNATSDEFAIYPDNTIVSRWSHLMWLPGTGKPVPRAPGTGRHSDN